MQGRSLTQKPRGVGLLPSLVSGLSSAVPVLLALALHWLWEMVQMPAYAEMIGLSWSETALDCLAASLGDLALTLAICGLGALAAGRRGWPLEGTWNVYLAAALLGALFASAVEWQALSVGRWSYTGRMPVVPLLGVGLLPFLQLTLLTPLILALTCWWVNGADRRITSGGGSHADLS